MVNLRAGGSTALNAEILFVLIPMWLLWQLADSAFPTGGFGHSGGLEAAWQQGEVNGAEQLAGLIRIGLVQLGRAMLPFVNEGWRSNRSLAELDELCDLALTNHVANRASRLQGQAWLRATERIFPKHELIVLSGAISDGRGYGHFAPVFGATCRTLELPKDSVVRLFMFLGLRAYMSSAVRLGIIGPFEGQALQRELAETAEAVSVRFGSSGVEEVAHVAPIMDILQGAQDRLYSRLFQS